MANMESQWRQGPMGRAECGRAMEKRRANERDEQETKTIGKSTTKRKKTKAGNLYMRSYIVDYPPLSSMLKFT